MADKKISELTEVTEAASADWLVIVDSGETKKISAVNYSNSPIPLDAALFNIAAAAPATTEGLLWYDSDDHTISIRTELSDVTLQVGQETHVRVKNDSGGDIDNGEVVYITGVDGVTGLPTVDLAKADAVATSKALGLATADILDGAVGRVTAFGLVRDINTSAFSVGDELYVSPTTAGALVNIAPDAPNTLSLIGSVLVDDAANGVILINTVVNSSVLDHRYDTVQTIGWPMGSPSGAFGNFYAGGYYDFAALDNDFSPPVNFGTANSAYAAHFMLVLGAVTVDELTIRVTGTSINDNGVRSAGDTQDIVIPNATPADTFYETSKKWLGQVAISVVSGTAKTCNYGWCKYWDNNNSDFTIVGSEALWLGGANDASADIQVLHHKATGWTFNVGAEPTPPTPIVSMNSDHVTEINIVNGEYGAWKRSNLSSAIGGSDSEGVIIKYVTSANKAFDANSQIHLLYSPS